MNRTPEPPHCLDCHVGDEDVWDWQEAPLPVNERDKEIARQWCLTGVPGYFEGSKLRSDVDPETVVNSLAELIAHIRVFGQF